MPLALVEHINGNAIYNVTCPLLATMVKELEIERTSFYNAVSYDYRLSQMFFEGSKKVPSHFPFPTLYGDTDPETAIPSKMEKFQHWWDQMGYDGFFTQSNVIANFGLEGIFEDLSDAAIVHGKQYSPLLPTSQQRRRLAHNEMYPHFKNVLDGFDKNSANVPFLWLIPQAGNVDRYIAACLRLVSASQSGVAYGHDQDNFLGVVGIGKERFVNIDTVRKEGIEHAIASGFPGSGLADVVVSPLVNDAASLFTEESNGHLFAVFRHPIDRAISMFHYLGHADWEPTYQPQFQQWTLEQFAESDFVESNWMTRSLSNNMEGLLSDTDFHLAANVLRNKILVGLTSKLPETVERFEKFFQWKFHHNPDEQEQCHVDWLDDKALTASEMALDQDSRAWKLLVAQNEYDIALYEIALQVWEEQEALFTDLDDGFRMVDATCCECDPPTFVDNFECGLPNDDKVTVADRYALPPPIEIISQNAVIQHQRQAQAACDPSYDPNGCIGQEDPTTTTPTMSPTPVASGGSGFLGGILTGVTAAVLAVIGFFLISGFFFGSSKDDKKKKKKKEKGRGLLLRGEEGSPDLF